MPFEGQVLVRDGPKVRGEGQEDQGVFQPLGLMHRHHPHQVGVRLQADLAGVAARALPGLLARLRQIAQEGMLTVEQAAGLLQQFGQVQQVGEDPLARERLIGRRRCLPRLFRARQPGGSGQGVGPQGCRDLAFAHGVQAQQPGRDLEIVDQPPQHG